MPVYVQAGGRWILIKTVSSGGAYGMLGEAVDPVRPRYCYGVPIDSTKASRLIAALVQGNVEAHVFLDPHPNGVDYVARICSEEKGKAIREARRIRALAKRIGALLGE